MPLKVPAFGGVVTVTKTASEAEQPLTVVVSVYVVVDDGVAVGLEILVDDRPVPGDHAYINEGCDEISIDQDPIVPTSLPVSSNT